LALIYLSLIEEFALRRKKLPTQNIAELIGSIPLSYFTFIVAGSFAQGKATKKSDLDIVVIVEDGINTSKILAILKNKGELMIPEAHPYVFTKSEFLQMLMSHEENYGKMVYRNRLIAFGAHNYYLIIREAIKNGFKG
jgi:predicted nucleotidyltransferase